MFFNRDEITRSEAIAAQLAELPGRLHGAWFFGAGAIGQSLLWHFRRRGLRVGGFVDNNPALWGREIGGARVISPAEYAAEHADGILVLALGKGLREVRTRCYAMGLQQVVSQYLCRAALGIVPFARRISAEEIESNRDAAEAMTIWADDASRDKFRRLVRFQNLFDDADLPSAEPGHYFSDAYIPKRYFESVVDVGACDGDTLREFLAATGGHFGTYYAFEPDPENFQKLELTAPPGDARIRLFNLGLDAEPGVRHLRGFGSLLSNLGEDGDMEARVESLDHLLGGASLTLIKMDVEGHEPHALAGMVNTIRRCRPALAISIYHQVDHLWSLPLWIRNLDLGYRLRVGCHGDLYSEAVCYAVPG